MHFFCAKIIGWLVIDKYNCFCGRHKPRNETRTKEFEAKAFNRKTSGETDAALTALTMTTSTDIVPIKQQPTGTIIKTEPNTAPPAPSSTMPVQLGRDGKLPQCTPPVLFKSGKPASFDRKVLIKLEPGTSLSPGPAKTGKPAAFEKLMAPPVKVTVKVAIESPKTEMPRLKELLAAPIGPALTPIPTMATTPPTSTKMDTTQMETMASNILTNQRTRVRTHNRFHTVSKVNNDRIDLWHSIGSMWNPTVAQMFNTSNDAVSQLRNVQLVILRGESSFNSFFIK